jgi:hypothetical protein
MDEAIETWEVTSYSDYELVIKLTFKNLLLISASQEKDNLNLTIN